MTGDWCRRAWIMAVLVATAAIAVDGAMATAAELVGLASAQPMVTTAGTVTAAVGALLVLAPNIGPRHDAAVWFGLLWLAVGVARHLSGEVDARFAGEEVSGFGHLVWDAAYHGPAAALSVLAAHRN